MSTREVEVCLDAPDGRALPVGRLSCIVAVERASRRRSATTSVGWSAPAHLRSTRLRSESSSGRRWPASTAIEDARDRTADIELLVSVADYFRVRDPREALRPILEATDRWREVATRLGVGGEVLRLEPAFEHPQREAARAIVGGRPPGTPQRKQP
jgi:hypothetical protein